jgi:predicted transposase YbfD/YdcC
MAKGIKDEPYSGESQDTDLEVFRAKLEDCMANLKDPRVSDNQTHSFENMIGIILCAVIAGANGISDIHHYATCKKAWLSQWLYLASGIPSYTAFWWLLVRLDPAQCEELFRNWIKTLSVAELKDVIAIDGKRVRGASKKRPESVLHMVSAWSSARGLVLGQLKTEAKSNEITAMPKLIDSLDISGAVITSDAMGCQKSITGKIVEKGGDYAIGLKGNQQSIRDEVANYFEQASAIEFEGAKVKHHQSICQGHGRIEARDLYVTSDIGWLPMMEEWPGLQSIAMIDSKRTENGKTSREIRYYITSLAPDPERLATVIRAHWGIENAVHWVLDVTFCEDASQVSTGNAAENLSIFRRLSLNILRLDSDTKTSLRAKRKKAGWNNDYLAELLASATVNSF